MIKKRECMGNARDALILLLLAWFTHPVFAQQDNGLTVTGLVSDSIGNVMSGVTVSALANSQARTQTDENGRFIIVVNSGTVLQFSSVGFEVRQVTVSESNKELHVILAFSTATVDEV